MVHGEFELWVVHDEFEVWVVHGKFELWWCIVSLSCG